ncbi:hypothetical protein [Sinomicrobium weinanense]|uniref:Cell division protein ZapB n=1 Tax=Sinomicrobium weinanense TaxID=2842200 RepID=A0A926JW26_9FLAO|nr:hypothetical protein [Sinomicrobium weinanense]MBC9798216.1 hypothetical protein [Sinomicrobium weinanense]MBU3122874.1 hypothetical protein [Sinomicrobium weinanense]
MSDITEIVDSLENRVSRLLHKMEILKQANQKLTQKLADSEKAIQEKESVITDWEEKYNALKLANTMLGSSENKTETKLKINTLIREIDSCIAQLSE